MNWDQQVEGDFYEYMHELDQVDQDWNRQVLEFYVPHFASCRCVLDVGCGEGQFIELLRAKGVNAVGIDVDAEMVSACNLKHLEVVQANLFDYLPGHPAEFDGIFSSNLIEHLSAADAFRFAELALKSLSPGGVFLVATPNPASLIVHLHEFWRDATHVRLYTAPLLEFLLHRSGFERVRSGENPKTAWTPRWGLDKVPDLLEDLTAWEELGYGILNMPDQPTLTGREQERSFWQRLTFELRRRVARFLAETVLFEEFASLDETLSELGQQVVILQRINHAVYRNLDAVLTAPREICAKGFKPTAPAKEI
ncbi:MAG: methyltransferase domain-containing protein [Chloroflexota bacterium]|nr:methyltransferase domain-containing protein [Chloroflexota bacterium]